MADSTLPKNQGINQTIPSTQDLQINLEEAPKIEESTISKNKESELNLDLDINLPESSKNDDRLKEEDKKNNEIIQQPVVAEKKIPTAPEAKIEDVFAPIPELEPTPTTQEQIIQKENIEEQSVKEAPTEPTEMNTPETKVSTTISEDIVSTEVPTDFNQDMKIIEELNMNENKGGLATEAKIDNHPAAEPIPKTFDLDAMLGTTPPPVTTSTSPEIPVEQKPITEMPIETKTVEQIIEKPVQTQPMTAPAFTIPTTTSEVPVQTIMQTSIPHSKNKGVKTLLFVVMFVALGFTTFFILKTMYPIEFSNIFGGSDIQMHASEDTLGET